MSHKDNMDLRNTGDGGWFYAEHELFSVFAPLIGPLGVSVYMAMCRLIPLAAVDPDRQVTERAVMEAACVSKGTAGRKMEEIARLGMVQEQRSSNRRSSTYKLVSLRTLALVGIEELRRRLGAPQGGTDFAEAGEDQAKNDASAVAQTAVPSGDASKPALNETLRVAKAPASSGKNGAPRWGTSRVSVETRLVDLLVPQKQASVPQKTASVPQKRGSLFKEEKEEEFNTPLPPSQAMGGLLPNIAASAAPNPKDKDQSKGPPGDGTVAGGKAVAVDDAWAVGRSVLKVQRECGLNSPRLTPAIERAMRSEAAKSDALANWNAIAERMIKSYKIWLESQDLLAYKPGAKRFFDEYWDDQRKWPWDEKRLREKGRL
jgi:hypothetical protein